MAGLLPSAFVAAAAAAAAAATTATAGPSGPHCSEMPYRFVQQVKAEELAFAAGILKVLDVGLAEDPRLDGPPAGRIADRV